MSDFLNGLGGLWGVPLWAFYVNRGQALASFGQQNKDGGIQKFLTAEKAYQQAPFTGFRTFVRGTVGNREINHMPFFPRLNNDDDRLQRDLKIGLNEMEIEEVDPANSLQTNVLYFTLPNEDFPALVRKTTFTNIDPTNEMKLEVLDGLGALVPSGLPNFALDSMGRTSEAYMNVYNVGSANSGGSSITQPFFHVSQSTADTAEVSIIKDGHFAIAFVDDEDSDDTHEPLSFVVDPSVVYGMDTTLTDPKKFFSREAQTLKKMVMGRQRTVSLTPCAFAAASISIPPGKKVTITSVYGHAPDLETFVGYFSPKLLAKGFTDAKRVEAADLVLNITESIETTTGSTVFDAYVKQDYLDNVLRGGVPIPLGEPENPKIFHTFSRIHGDIERDYNDFQIDTTYFSQGPGNFRDVSQNRRLDVLLHPVVGDFNVRMFLSLCQADAYNPLTVATTNFKVPVDKISDLVDSLKIDTSSEKSVSIVKKLLSKPFRPGALFKALAAAGVNYKITKDELLSKVTAAADQVTAARFGQNGYWTDHWTYTMDLLDNYLSVFPDKEEYLLFDSEPVPFFQSPAYVKSRAHRYVLVDNPNKPGTSTIRVYKPISIWGEPDFSGKIEDAFYTINNDPALVSDVTGAGGIWQRVKKTGEVMKVSVLGKLLMLGITKFSTQDPHGMGVEMEGGKPGWNDAMNGLPGILGSGMPETYEMLRIIRYSKKALEKFPRAVTFPDEFCTFLTSLSAALDAYGGSAKDTDADFGFWDAANDAREAYRTATIATFNGNMCEKTSDELVALLSSIDTKVTAGIAKAVTNNGGFSPTYFAYECTDYKESEITTKAGPATAIKALGFEQRGFPMFLEGPTRYFKVVDDIKEKRKIYQMVRESALYDAPLKMYTLSESLSSLSASVGRMVAFSPGWLENQSVWLHMSYKFYLELLRGGLYEEFFEEIKTGLVPFMDSGVYGRSTLEAASFIVSSAFPDKSLAGTGFLARLSGSTAEFLSMWAIMMCGEAPFTLDKSGDLQLQLSPVLPGWLFTEEGTVSFKFLGTTVVTYINPTKADTWKMTPKSVSVTWADGKEDSYEGNIFSAKAAKKIRNFEATAITVNF